jgi:hypothetical protein
MAREAAMTTMTPLEHAMTLKEVRRAVDAARAQGGLRIGPWVAAVACLGAILLL